MSKTVIITGASSGIGAACAKLLLQSGYNVAVCYNKNEASARAICKNFNTACAKPFFVDVKCEDSVKKLIEEVLAAFGDIDAVINNAGNAHFGMLADLTVNEWDNIFATHARGAFLCSKYALPYMVRKKSGNIINISSMWGQVGASCEVAYSAAKAAVIGFTKALAKEVGPSGINVNCIAPGVIKTPMLDGFSSEDMQALTDETPLCRLGTPEDIAKAVRFLLSCDADFITGQILGVNGGFVV